MTEEIESVDDLESFLEDQGAPKENIETIVNAFESNGAFNEGTDVTVELTARKYDESGELKQEETASQPVTLNM